MNPKTFILIFCSSFLVNIFYALYVKYIAEDKRLKAAIFGELVHIAGAVTVIQYTRDPWYIIPMVIGGFLGTYFVPRNR